MAGEAGPPVPRAWFGTVSAVLVAATVLVYAPVGQHDFIAFDDPQYVVENRHVNGGLTWDNVRWAFTAGEQGNWHPATWLSHMLDVELFGLDAGAHHLTNVGLHALNTVLLLLVLLRLGCARWQSAAVAGLFALHPMHVESVAWVAERKDVLSGAFWWLALLAYVAYVRRRAAWRYLLLLVCFAAGLMSKPMVVTLPFVLLLLDFWPLRRVTDPARPFGTGWPLVVEKLPLIALAAAASVVTFVVQQESGAVRSLESLSIGRRIATALTAYDFYLSRVILPRDLAVLYPFPEAVPHAAVVSGAALIVALSVFAIALARTRPWAVVGWLWFVGTLVPVIGLVQVGSQPFADRYTYLPYVGLFIAIVWAVAELSARSAMLRRTAAAAAVLFVAALAAQSHRYVQHWRDGIALWTHTLSVTERNYRAHHALGVALEDAGRDAEAAAQYESAVAIRPTYAEALNNLAGIRADQGDLAAASQHLTAALAVAPDHPESMATLAVVRARQGRVDEAVRLFQIARDHAPESTSIRNGLAFALSQAGRFQEARAELEAALRISPRDPDLLANLGLVLADLGDIDAASRTFQQALAIDSSHARTRYGLGLVLHETGRTEEALRELAAAIRFDPALADAHHEYGRALAGLGRLDESVAALETAVRLRETDPTLHYDLAVMLLKSDRRDAAIRHLERALQLDPRHEDAFNALRALGRIK